MARYEVLIKPSARKELEAIGLKEDRQRIVEAILALAENLCPVGCLKLSGRDKYRIRSVNYRVIHSVQDFALVVPIVKVGHRKSVYR